MRVEENTRGRRRWLALTALVAGGCTIVDDWKPLPQPWTDGQVAHEREVRVSCVGEPTLTLREVRIEGSGGDARIVGRDPLGAVSPVSVPLGSVAAIEVKRTDPAGVAILLTIVGLLLAMW